MSIVKAAIFDVFGTVVDWRNSVSKTVSQRVSDKDLEIDCDAFADHWRSLYVPSMTPIIEGQRSYVSLDDLHLENLQNTLRHFDIDGAFTDAECITLSKAWECLDPWQILYRACPD